MKIGRKVVSFCLVGVGLLCAGITISNAYSGYYSFKIKYSVTGSNTHSLSSRYTTISSRANTYSGNKAEKYTVSLVKGWSKYNSGSRYSNGNVYSNGRNIGKGYYKVKVNLDTNNSRNSNMYIQGSGYVSQ